MREKELEKLKDYKYGFSTDIENFKAPKGPPCAKKKYTNKPTTTGGIPIKELIIINIKFFKYLIF